MLERWAGVILAAGKGARMRSRYPKMLHPVAGKPMLLHVLGALQDLQLPRTVIVVGRETSAIRGPLVKQPNGQINHAPWHRPCLLQTGPLLQHGPSRLLVANGDVPLVQPQTLRRMMEHHTKAGAAMTIATYHRPAGHGLGRVLRSPDRAILAVVEDAEATEDQRAITETNEGLYCFEAEWVWNKLPTLPPHRNGEHYLTDLVGMAAAEGRPVASVTLEDSEETLGVNDRVDLARAEAAMRRRIRNEPCAAG